MPLSAAQDGPVLSFTHDNDLFVDEDNNYTSGLRLGWTGAEEFAPDFLHLFSEKTGLLSDATHKIWSFEMGQNMYTPTSLSNAPPTPTDRPYAGWLYAGVAYSGLHDDVRDTFSLTLGMVGPASLAAESQDFLHTIQDGIRPRGWGSQLKTEPGIVLGFERRWPALLKTQEGPAEFDFTPVLGASVGNIFTHASAGGVLRMGQNLLLEEAPGLSHPALSQSCDFAADGFGWYLFAGGGGRAIARDIFLDGNSFAAGPSVSKENFVGEFQAGAVLLAYGTRFGFTYVLRSPEFEGQKTADGYAGLSAAWHY